MTSKIIFLDFDGPLSNLRTELAMGCHHQMDPVAIRALNNFCEASGAKIVCTSTRARANSWENKRENFTWFEMAGLDLGHIHPNWSGRYNRGKRSDTIKEWLSRHPEVTHHVIIDDESVDLPNLVKVRMYDGIMSHHFRRAAKILDFDLVKAYQEARSKTHMMGQLLLPFEDYHASFNERLLDKTLHLK